MITTMVGHHQSTWPVVGHKRKANPSGETIRNRLPRQNAAEAQTLTFWILVHVLEFAPDAPDEPRVWRCVNRQWKHAVGKAR